MICQESNLRMIEKWENPGFQPKTKDIGLMQKYHQQRIAMESGSL